MDVLGYFPNRRQKPHDRRIPGTLALNRTSPQVVDDRRVLGHQLVGDRLRARFPHAHVALLADPRRVYDRVDLGHGLADDVGDERRDERVPHEHRQRRSVRALDRLEDVADRAQERLILGLIDERLDERTERRSRILRIASRRSHVDDRGERGRDRLDGAVGVARVTDLDRVRSGNAWDALGSGDLRLLLVERHEVDEVRRNRQRPHELRRIAHEPRTVALVLARRPSVHHRERVEREPETDTEDRAGGLDEREQQRPDGHASRHRVESGAHVHDEIRDRTRRILERHALRGPHGFAMDRVRVVGRDLMRAVDQRCAPEPFRLRCTVSERDGLGQAHDRLRRLVLSLERTERDADHASSHARDRSATERVDLGAFLEANSTPL